MQLITHICSKGGAGETEIFVCSYTTYPNSVCSLLKKDLKPGNALMGCALTTDLAPEAAAVSPLITGDRSSSFLLVGTIGMPDVGTILAMLGSKGL